MSEQARIDQKKNEILHDLKAVATAWQNFSAMLERELDRLNADVEKLCAMRKDQTEEAKHGTVKKFSECPNCELGGVIGSGGICSACGQCIDKIDTDVG